MQGSNYTVHTNKYPAVTASQFDDFNVINIKVSNDTFTLIHHQQGTTHDVKDMIDHLINGLMAAAEELDEV